jgi:ABC-type antimicrobial peptide transport system permease subunit
VYGLISYSVAQRRREIGIRVALGARAGTVVTFIVRQGVRIEIVGVVLGLAMTAAVAQFLSALLYGVAPRDPVILAGVGVVLVAIGAIASLIPARRAATVDVVDALK